MDRILVPLDGSETAEKVLPWVISEALVHGATVVLLRAVPPLRGGLLMMPPRLREQTDEFANGIAQEYLAQVAERLQAQGLNVEARTEHGPPSETILDVAEEIGCDLIVIGSRGETAALRWRFGSVAAKIVRTQTTMPVVVIST
jgi:nucleotide-binding universal stress UspA family protein